MVYRPLQIIGRFVLAACAVSFGAASLSAQSAPSTTAPTGPNPSRVDVFLGYSYYGAHGQVKPAGIAYSSIDLGAIGSGAYYLNKFAGGEIVYANHPDGKNDGMSSISAGPIFRAPMQNFTVFAHGLVGIARLGGPNNEGAFAYHEPYRWGPALTVGGGMDYDLPFLSNRFSLRLFEADYKFIHTNYGPYVAPPTGGIMGGRTNLSGVELSTGILLHFGHVIPPPPVTYSCAVSPTTVFPGDPITVTGTALNLDPEEDSDVYLVSGRWHGLWYFEHCDHRHQDCRTRLLHGEGSCVRRRKAWPDGGLHCELHGENSLSRLPSRALRIRLLCVLATRPRLRRPATARRIVL